MTLPALDGIPEKLQALLTYDASSPLIFSSTRLNIGCSIAVPPLFSIRYFTLFLPFCIEGKQIFFFFFPTCSMIDKK